MDSTLETALAIISMIIAVLGALGLGTWFGAEIKRELSYLCCFLTRNLESLEHETGNLNNKRSELKERIRTDETNGRLEVRLPVNDWIRDCDTITSKKVHIVAKATEVKSSCCCNFVGRYSVSKDAVETSERMKKLIERCTFQNVTLPFPIAATSPIEFGKAIHDISSRQVFEDGVMETLKREDVCKIGIWGIGGVGKTTMAQKILNRAVLTEGFGEVAEVTVGDLPVGDLLVEKKLEIQDKIAAKLGLELTKGTDLSIRAHKLRERLKQPENQTLLLLDDVWQVLNLAELGIPYQSKWCKVIITSRNRDVLTEMVDDAEHVRELGVLDDNEAWHFFKKITNPRVESDELKPTAYAVMEKCHGLLLALEIVGVAHKEQNHQDVWEDSLEKLTKSNPEGITNVLEKVYRPLELSYERLEDEDAKSTFLLCCLIAKHTDIPLEHLTHFAMGLRLFKNIGELKKERVRIRRMTDMLRNRRMLLDGSSEDHVRMHDVVRDVCTHIASEKKLVKHSDCAWISSFVQPGVRPVPGLKLLFLNGKVEREMEIDDNLIGGSTKLNVLRIEHGSLTTLTLIVSLTTLVLRDCASLRSIAVVGQLESLEILSCRYCHSMNEFLKEVKGLKRLRLLEISSCRNLIKIAAGVISSLLALEELKIVRSFSNWQGSEGGNNATTSDARLREIESLRKLRRLDIQVSDINLAAQPLCLQSQLVQFTVHFGMDGYPTSRDMSYQRVMSLLDDVGDISITNYRDSSSAANTFLASTEWLYADGEHQAAFMLNLATARNIRRLNLYRFGNEKNITSAAAAAAAFPLLESFSLELLPKLEEIWSDALIPLNSFNKLKYLKLGNLPALKQMGKCSAISATAGFFVQLEVIIIEGCEKMEHLLYLEPNGDKITLVFPKLKRLDLFYLPKLMSICSSRRIDSIRFPLLENMNIHSCQNLKCLNSSRDDDGHWQDEDSSHLFCHPRVTFGNLKALHLYDTTCKNAWCTNVPDGFFRGLVQLQVIKYIKVKSLSSSRVAQNLVNLQKLDISGCDEMVKVIEDDGDVSSHDNNIAPLFPSLQHLSLWKLPKLESFCEWGCGLELPSLKNLEIFACYKMKYFNSPGSLSAPALREGSLNGTKVANGVDVNAALRQQYEREERDLLSMSRRAAEKRVKSAILQPLLSSDAEDR